MISKKKKKHTGNCLDCGGSLELLELNVQKNRRVLQCKECGLLLFYKKELFGSWKLTKAARSQNK